MHRIARATLAALAAVGLGAPQAPFKNIQVGPLEGNGRAFEPSVAVNRKNPRNILAATMANAISTVNGGKTWRDVPMKSSLGMAGDPALVSDADGNFYFFHLSNGSQPDGWLDRIVCQKSKDGGATWSDGASIGFNHPADQDKAWPAAHPSKPFLCVSWTQFDKYASRSPSDRSNILFSASADGGESWSPAVRINDASGDCLDGDDTTEGAVPAIDAAGYVYVAWSLSGTLYFDRSADGGKTWLKKDVVIGPQVGGWDMAIPGLGRANGMPVLMVDNSKGPHRGTLYVVWADQRAGANDTDVFLAKSTDRGETWSKPVRVNKDGPGKHQFFPWLAVDETTGYLYVVYYDRRAYEDNQTDVIVASSTDGGETFRETVVSEKPFTPTSARGAFFGDYNNISAHGGTVVPIWTRMDGNRTTVWTAILKQADLVAKSP